MLGDREGCLQGLQHRSSLLVFTLGCCPTFAVQQPGLTCGQDCLLGELQHNGVVRSQAHILF